MPRQLLLRIISFTGRLFSRMVASSWMFICTEPSPAMHTTRLSGLPAWAPMAAGRPKPMVPAPPLLRKVRLRVQVRYWAAHIWCWPTSVV